MRASMPTLPQLLHGAMFHAHWRALLAALLAIVCVAALAPGSDAPSLGIGDKIDHLSAFVALAVAAALSWPAAWRHAMRAGVGLLVYGALIELAQTQVPGRHGDAADLLVDAAGIALGLALAQALRRRWPATTP
jgi:VanZ family protein